MNFRVNGTRLLAGLGREFAGTSLPHSYADSFHVNGPRPPRLTSGMYTADSSRPLFWFTRVANQPLHNYSLFLSRRAVEASSGHRPNQNVEGHRPRVHMHLLSCALTGTKPCIPSPSALFFRYAWQAYRSMGTSSPKCVVAMLACQA